MSHNEVSYDNHPLATCAARRTIKKTVWLSKSENQTVFMPVAGLEPARIAPHDFESCASANSATPALTKLA